MSEIVKNLTIVGDGHDKVHCGFVRRKGYGIRRAERAISRGAYTSKDLTEEAVISMHLCVCVCVYRNNHWWNNPGEGIVNSIHRSPMEGMNEECHLESRQNLRGRMHFSIYVFLHSAYRADDWDISTYRSFQNSSIFPGSSLTNFEFLELNFFVRKKI